MEICPFGTGCGSPCSFADCDLGFMDCHCVKELLGFALGEYDDQMHAVVKFWRTHRFGFCDAPRPGLIVPAVEEHNGD